MTKLIKEMTAAVVLDPEVSKMASKTMTEVKANLKSFGKADYQIVPKSAFKAEIVVNFKKVLDPRMIRNASALFYDAIDEADVNGRTASIQETGNGENFVEAVIAGLKPGMVVKAEAFFPTLSYEITWKQMIKKK